MGDITLRLLKSIEKKKRKLEHVLSILFMS